MRGKGLLACVAVVMMSHGAQAEGEPSASAGLIEAPIVGETIFGGIDRPGLRLAHRFRFRIDGFSDNLATLTHGISPFRTQAIDGTRRRRFNALVDFFPIDETGFHLTMGYRRSPKRARWNPAALASLDIFTPKAASPMRVRSNVARSSPTAQLGWSGSMGDDVHVSLSAGALQEHGRPTKVSPMTIARGQRPGDRWSGIGAVASAAVNWRF